MCVAFVQRELECLRLRERVDVMAHDVVIRELHQGASANDEHVRHELVVLLIHASRPLCRVRFLRRGHRRRVHGHLRYGFAVLIADLDFERAGDASERETHGDQRRRCREGARPRQPMFTHANYPWSHEIEC